MSRRPQPSKQDIAGALATNDALDKVQRQRPKWEDYVAEGVIDSVPKPDASGNCRVQVSGHGNVVRMLQMNEQANNLAAWHGDNRAESSPRRSRREERSEAKARKQHRPRASIIVPEMPWKRKRGRKVGA